MRGDLETRNCLKETEILNQLIHKMNRLVESDNSDSEVFPPSPALLQLVGTIKNFANTFAFKMELEAELELKSRDNQIQLYELQVEYQRLEKKIEDDQNEVMTRKDDLKNIIREALIEDNLQAKAHYDGVHKQIVSELDGVMWLAETRARKWKSREEGILKGERMKLMAGLESQILEYDEGMERRQNELDEAEADLLRKCEDFQAARVRLASVDVIYDEMSRAKKLQQILRNIAKADVFRKERAATTIQRAWRELKRAKEKRRRGKKGKKRRGGAGQKEGTPSSTDSMFKQILHK